MSKITGTLDLSVLGKSLAESVRSQSLVAEQLGRAAERLQLHDSLMGGAVRLTAERLQLHDSLMGGAARLAAERLQLHDSLMGGAARLAKERLQLHESLMGGAARLAAEQLRMHDNLIGGAARQAAERFQLNIDHQFDSWKKIDQVLGIDSRNMALLQRAHETWTVGIHSLLKRTIEAGIWENNPSLGLRISSLPAVYTSFCRSTGRNLRLTQNGHLTKALEGSLVLAEDHLLKSIEIISPLLRREIEPEPLSSLRATRLYQVQQTELSAAPEIQDAQNLDELVGISEAAASEADVLKMLQLIPEVNCAAKLLGHEDIFKPTSRMLEAFTDLFGLVPTNKIEFGKFIDCLYWLFFEAAGADNLRYLSNNGGPLTESDCDLIWAIKTFRNKWYRHDPDHGNVTGVRKSYRSLSEALKRFGFAQIPCNANQYRRFHRALVRELIAFLEQLRGKLI